jgi:hypothetical protein
MAIGSRADGQETEMNPLGMTPPSYNIHFLQFNTLLSVKNILAVNGYN